MPVQILQRPHWDGQPKHQPDWFRLTKGTCETVCGMNSTNINRHRVQSIFNKALHYAERKGWTVADEHVYVDDGISGAEFANRPGFFRLMNALKLRPAFQVLVMSEESRLGREAIETAYALKQLVTAGVRVFFYLEDRERTLDSPTDKIMMSLTAFADELEREKARPRTYDAMLRKATAGHVTGGRVFGYDNVEIIGPDGRRSHVDRRINAGEAAIVAGTGALRNLWRGHVRQEPQPRQETTLSLRVQIISCPRLGGLHEQPGSQNGPLRSGSARCHRTGRVATRHHHGCRAQGARASEATHGRGTGQPGWT